MCVTLTAVVCTDLWAALEPIQRNDNNYTNLYYRALQTFSSRLHTTLIASSLLDKQTETNE